MNRMMATALLACAAVPGIAQKIRIDYDHKCDFSRYKTYSWVESPEAPYPNQLMQQRIVGMVEEALAAKRLTRTPTGGDILISYQMNVSELPQFTTFTDGFGPGWGHGWGNGWDGWGSSISTTTTQTILLGTLVVDMTDARKNQLIFQGTSSDEISSKPEKNIKRYRKGIDKMFEKYPPRP
jgi:hypothetical protein